MCARVELSSQCYRGLVLERACCLASLTDSFDWLDPMDWPLNLGDRLLLASGNEGRVGSLECRETPFGPERTETSVWPAGSLFALSHLIHGGELIMLTTRPQLAN